MDVITLLCKRCKKELIKGDPICPRCDYDNSKTKKKRKIIDVEGGQKVKAKKHIPLSVYIILLTIICIIVLFYINLKVNNSDNNVYNSSLTTTEENIKKFVFKDLHIKYPRTYKTTKNSIYLKSNDNINIFFETIKKDEYDNYLTSNDCLDSRLNVIETKTFAGDNYYSHIFKFKKRYYKITVNYVNNSSIYNQDVQLEISKILNTLS